MNQAHTRNETRCGLNMDGKLDEKDKQNDLSQHLWNVYT